MRYDYRESNSKILYQSESVCTSDQTFIANVDLAKN